MENEPRRVRIDWAEGAASLVIVVFAAVFGWIIGFDGGTRQAEKESRMRKEVDAR